VRLSIYIFGGEIMATTKYRPKKDTTLKSTFMELNLRQLSISDGIDVYNMLQEIDENEYGFTNEVKGMSFDDYKKWLVQENDYSKGQNLPDRWIPQTTYFLYAGEQPVGIARVRHYSCDLLEKQGVGNFGYAIAKPYRGKGYGNALLLYVLKKCKLHGYKKIKSFIDIDNVASNKVFIRNGSKLIGVFNGKKNIYETTII
jgi:predicted acetyltransferase